MGVRWLPWRLHSLPGARGDGGRREMGGEEGGGGGRGGGGGGSLSQERDEGVGEEGSGVRRERVKVSSR